jgi:hypothetical protein
VSDTDTHMYTGAGGYIQFGRFMKIILVLMCQCRVCDCALQQRRDMCPTLTHNYTGAGGYIQFGRFLKIILVLMCQCRVWC